MMGITDWEKWAKDHHIKLPTKEQLEKEQFRKEGERLFKGYVKDMNRKHA